MFQRFRTQLKRKTLSLLINQIICKIKQRWKSLMTKKEKFKIEIIATYAKTEET